MIATSPCVLTSRKIEACLRQLSVGLPAQKFGRGREHPRNLALSQSCARGIETAAFLYFNKDDLVAKAKHQVDFAAPSAIAPFQ